MKQCVLLESLSAPRPRLKAGATRRAVCLAIAVAALLAACDRRERAPSPPESFPSVRRVQSFELADRGPEIRPGLPALIALSPSGHVAYTAGFDTSGALITVVDTTGGVVARFGRAGPGPGELGQIQKLQMTDSTVVAFAMGPSRVTTYSLDGRILSEYPGPGLVMVVGMIGDSIDVMALDTRDRAAIRVAGFRRQAMDGTGGRTIIDSTTSSFRGFREPPPGSTGMGILLYAAEPRRVAIVNVRERAMRLYDAKGSVVEEVDSLQFAGSPFFDADGRLWFVGVRDSTVHAAVRTADSHSAPYPLECRQHSGAALNGMWLAILCRDEASGGDAGLELQLYRIEPAAPQSLVG
jgi:hypothetical protein